MQILYIKIEDGKMYSRGAEKRRKVTTDYTDYPAERCGFQRLIDNIY